jgi:hypothetical protein
VIGRIGEAVQFFYASDDRGSHSLASAGQRKRQEAILRFVDWEN